MAYLFDEKEFINSIVNGDNNDYQKALYDKYSNEIVFGSKKEQDIYSNYEKTFIIDIDLNARVMIQMSFNDDIIFINHIPSLFDILQCKIDIERENAYLSDADTDNEY
jgi:hypothetical protein